METNTTQQEPMMQAEPQKEHQWLQKLVGEWTYESEALIEPDQTPVKATGTETVRSLGEFWVLAEGQGEMPGCGPVTTLMTIGYDSEAGRFVGTWVGSMMSYLWLYNGELNASETVLTLNSEGLSMTGDGTMTKYKDVIELKDDNHRMMTSHALGNDGQWHQFMTVRYQRQP